MKIYFKEILGLINNIKINQKRAEENIGQEFRLKKIDKTWNYFINEIKQNELISEKHKKVCKILNYTKHLLTVASAVTGRVLISSFSSLFGIPVGITSSAITRKSSVITAGQ